MTEQLKTITLTSAQESYLTVLLNVELRGRMLADDYRRLLDGIFVQLVNKHHESMVWSGLLESMEVETRDDNLDTPT